MHEDEDVIAFMDIAPLAPGHVLVVPKEERERLHELSPRAAEALGRALRRVASAVVEATGCPDYNVLQNNGAPAHQAVPHVHFHVIPRMADGRGLGLSWRAGALDAAEGAAMAERIAACMRHGR
ncbi:MAG: hypothetical protein RI990_528 [Planctomycetota bacterium]